MIRIAGITINPNKQARFALTPIRGIGKNNIKKILDDLGIPHNMLMKDVSETKLVEIRNYLEKNMIIENDLRRQVVADIKRMIEINCHRGRRHKAGLPVRHQTTRVNNRTRRGNRRNSLGSGRAKAASKT